MSRVRSGKAQHGVEGAPCMFCGWRVREGAFWMSAPDLWVCAGCARDGQLGKLLGDAVRNVADLERALAATAQAAWRALCLAQEREHR